MGEQDRVAVIGAGVIGCAVAWALARGGHRVLLLDPAPPGVGGASFGNVGQIATELLEPLPSVAMLFGFWRELFAFGGALDISASRLPHLARWARGFAAAAFKRAGNTPHLAALVRPACTAWERLLGEVGGGELLRRHGHCQVWFGRTAARRACAEADNLARLGLTTTAASAELARAVGRAAGEARCAGLKFEDSGHVLDPRVVCETLARAAAGRGASVRPARVLRIAPNGARLMLHTTEGALDFAAAVVCAGAWSGPLLAPFGLRVPLEAVRGYHLELPGQAPLLDAPIIYMDENIVVTPMNGRLRASSYMEFNTPEAAPDPRKVLRLREHLVRLGYPCEPGQGAWVGSRPVLPDYLPGIGRVAGGVPLYYAVGHHHLGLTLAPVTAELMLALLSGRTPEHNLAPFDLRRF